VVSVFDGDRKRVARSRRHADFLNRPPSPSLRQMMDEARSDEATGVTLALEGDEIYTAFTRSRTTGWTVAIGIPSGIVRAAELRALAAYGGGLLLSLALGVLAALFIGRGITAPMARLAQAARALGRREPLEVPRTGIQEIREVGSALTAAADERTAHEAERETLLEREQRARAAAEGANRAKDEFLAMLGHELRNPLGAISSASRLLEDERADEATRRRAREVLARQVTHLARLTDDLLDAGRAILGKIVLRRAPLELGATVAATLGTMRSAGRLSAHRIRTELGSVWVNADAARIEQIVINLVGNAVKYTPGGGSITVRVQRERDQALLTVTDSGAGMPADLVPRVFDAFVQGERELDRAHGGLGIGLTLVRRLAELHGGSASARSAGAGLGSEFRVHLPAIETAATVAEDARIAPAPKSRDVLLVEDNPDAAEMLRRVLELGGHRVRIARDGVEALEALRREPPDVALVDLGLPRMNGYELVRRARASVNGRRPLFVALTGYGLEEDRRRALEAGFDHHLVKPVDPRELERVLQ
jgi:signal transduction histidine kinase/CheY-like chemotaxis protein